MSPVTLSVLDRLIDLEPQAQREQPLSRAQSVRMLKSAVRRDLEWLLNTRRIATPPDRRLANVNRSVYVLGLEDFAGQRFDSLRLLRHIQDTVQQFEPRLRNVRVLQHDESAKTRAVRFRIEASLVMDPSPERVSFDTLLELASGQYAVRAEE